MIDQRFQTAKGILDRLEAYHHKAYFVGGAIRDLLLDRTTGDIDIATSASPQQVQQLFDKVIPVGIEHGTVVVRFEGESFEVTTFRVEGAYSDYRHPDHVHFVDQIEEDLARRDFTINAIAMDKAGDLVDPFSGQRDLNQQMIRTVGDPEQRFSEDPLRMLRALRFSSQLGFTLEPNTYAALKENIEWIEKIAIERITTELEKMFAGTYSGYAMKMFVKANVAEYVPLLAKSNRLLKFLEVLDRPLHSLTEVIAAFSVIEPSISNEQWAKQWKLSNQTKNHAKQLSDAIQQCDKTGLDKWLVYQLDKHLHASLVRITQILSRKQTINLENIKMLYQQLPIHTRQDLAINGHDLISLFPKRNKGPWMKQLLREIEYQVVVGNVNNTKQAIGEWVKKWNPPETN
ncbi:CCA tRNA nucleotidyltransferase [Aquibacillus sediminis]|uniref:CCA tRNA nucleotidyltransferase n=1 Tax=Aquibacillus sediminis TaxID=2574734 RepID=UPI0014872135|nr:CCA tRNA nucleotidyltransferase [Aquibacillus sediminis]